MSRRLVVAALVRLLLLAATWWVVSEGSTVVGPQYAVPVVLAAAAASLWVAPPRAAQDGRPRLRPWPLLRFAGWFVVESVRGGVDVAVRAVRPRMGLDPGLVDHPLRLRDRAAAVLLADTVSLLPGTLAVVVHEDRLTLHVLDRGGDVLAEVAEAERRIAAGLGLTLAAGPAPRRGERPAGG